MENEPETIFHQVHNAGKQLLTALDNHWTWLGFAIEVTSKGNRKHPSKTYTFESVREAMVSLAIGSKPVGSILKGLMGEKEWVYGYKWKLKKIKL